MSFWNCKGKKDWESTSVSDRRWSDDDSNVDFYSERFKSYKDSYQPHSRLRCLNVMHGLLC